MTYAGRQGAVRCNMLLNTRRTGVENFLFINSPGSVTIVPSDARERLMSLCKEGRLKDALHIADVQGQHDLRLSSDVYFCLLEGCGNVRALSEGKCIHASMIKSG